MAKAQIDLMAVGGGGSIDITNPDVSQFVGTINNNATANVAVTKKPRLILIKAVLTSAYYNVVTSQDVENNKIRITRTKNNDYEVMSQSDYLCASSIPNGAGNVVITNKSGYNLYVGVDIFY